MENFKRERQAFLNTEKRVENSSQSGAFLTTVEVSGNVVKLYLECRFDISSQSNLKLRRKRRNKIAKKHRHGHKIPLFKLSDLLMSFFFSGRSDCARWA